MELPSQQRRLGRRRALGFAGGGGAALALIAAGCSSQKQPGAKTGGAPSVAGSATNSASIRQPKHGGTILDSRYQNITGRTMDPHVETPISNKMRRLWYQGLLGYNIRTFALEPEVAQKWEQPDQTSYVFHLQPGVKWHNKPPANGRALVADDVVFSLNRVRTNDPKFLNRSLLDSTDQVQAVDPATVRITTKRPDVAFLPKMSSDGVLLLNPEVVAKAQKFATADECVGTGAFILKNFQDQVSADSVRNPDYWKQGLPYLDGQQYKYFGDPQQAYAALIAGQIDLADVTGQQEKDYLGRQPKGAPPPELAKATGTGGAWLMANMRVKPFDDARLPRALRLLMDVEEMVTAWGKVFFPDAIYGSVFCTTLDQWDLTQDEYKQRIFWKQPKDDAVKEALSLLSAAGYSKDKPLSFETLTSVNAGEAFSTPFAQLLQAQWRRLGQGAVDAQLKIVDGNQGTQARAQGTFGFGLLNNSGAYDDPDPWLSDLFRTKASRNYVGFSDPEVDALIDKQQVAFDAAQRRALVKQAVTLLADRSPMVFPCRVWYLNGVANRVQNHIPEATLPYGRQYEQVWING